MLVSAGMHSGQTLLGDVPVEICLGKILNETVPVEMHSGSSPLEAAPVALDNKTGQHLLVIIPVKTDNWSQTWW